MASMHHTSSSCDIKSFFYRSPDFSSMAWSFSKRQEDVTMKFLKMAYFSNELKAEEREMRWTSAMNRTPPPLIIDYSKLS